ncbi:autophagy-related protein 27-domain-containing protein [Amylocystis lapponica]|nr:autophagy-related protein 27-domain-containing protein [Amylocystis lapponica]
MISAAMLIAMLALVASVAAASVHLSAADSDSLARQCHITLKDQRFDLCPLLKANEGHWTVEDERLTPPTTTKTTYYLSLHGPLKKDKDAPEYDQCPDGTWICLQVTNRNLHSESEKWRVLQAVPVAGELSVGKGDKEASSEAAEAYVPGLKVTAALSPTLEDSKHDILHVHLHGGYYVKRQQKAVLAFICDHNATELSSPTYSWNWNGTHTLSWRSKHACPQKAIVGTSTAADTPTPSKKPDAEPDREMPPKEHTGDEHKLIDPNLDSDRARRSMMTIATSASAIVLLIYLIYFPPRRMRRLVTAYVKAHPRLLRARVAERVLVRWAYEDLEFERGEEDTMVNADEEFTASDEQIPLKPSPRHSVLIDYGTAR